MMTKILTWVFSIAFMIVMAVSVQAERLVPDSKDMTIVGIQVEIGPDGLIPTVLTVADLPISLSIDEQSTESISLHNQINEGYGGNMNMTCHDCHKTELGPMVQISDFHKAVYINEPECVNVPPEKIPL